MDNTNLWLYLIVINLVSITCIIGAVILLYNNIDIGWGWLLFIGAISAQTIKSNKNDEE